MKAWQVGVNGKRTLAEIPDRPPPAGGLRIRMQAAPVLSYLRQVLEGQLGYALPPRPFIPGTSGVGIIEAVGPGVRHLAAGQRVLLDPRLVADERVAEPAQILIGLTAMSGSAPTLGLQADWRDGTFAEVAHMPASVVTALPAALDATPPERVVGLSKLAVPYGGLLRAGFTPGEILVVNGASGYFGSAGVLVALALGAARVVAAGRDRAALGALAGALGARVAAVALTGDAATDAEALRRAAGGPVDVALDLVGRADSTAATNAALHALRRGGRLVIMGSAAQPLALDLREMLAQDWHVMGCFMYPKDAPGRLAALAASGVIDLGKLRVRTFPLGQLEAALEAAARMRGLDLTVLLPDR